MAPAVEVFSTVAHSIGSDVSFQDEIAPFYFIVLNACHSPGDNKKVINLTVFIAAEKCRKMTINLYPFSAY